MGPVLGDILPLAVGIAISPVPIIAAILMLLSPRAARTSLGFLTGWVIGILAAVILFTLLSTIITPSESTEPTPIAGATTIVLGASLIGLSVRGWRSRPRETDAAELPAWMSAIDTMSAGRALVLGVLLAGPNPKNLLMGAGAGLAIGSADLTVTESAIAITVFTLIAASSVALPVVLYLAARSRMMGTLERLRAWLTANNATVMAVLMLVIGTVLIGKGIGQF